MLVLVGAALSQEDIAKLKSECVAEVFYRGFDEDSVSFFRQNVKARKVK